MLDQETWVNLFTTSSLVFLICPSASYLTLGLSGS